MRAVTLVEYGDYECPHCGRAYPIVKELQSRLESELRFVFRNFPLSQIHPHAEQAAEAAEAAAVQGKFWEMHDMIFEHQQALTDRHLLEYARALGLDEQRFQRELTSQAYAPRVREDFLSGIKSGVNGTPTFLSTGSAMMTRGMSTHSKQALSRERQSAIRSSGSGNLGE